MCVNPPLPPPSQKSIPKLYGSDEPPQKPFTFGLCHRETRGSPLQLHPQSSCTEVGRGRVSYSPRLAVRVPVTSADTGCDLRTAPQQATKHQHSTSESM
jgi:hypothetical protein